MKIGVVTICTKECQSYGNLFVDQLSAYCGAHGYGLVVHRDNPATGRHVFFGKYVAARRMLERYDWVFWTDVDSFIESPQIRLENFIIPGAEFIIGNDIGSINAGHWLVKNCSNGRDLMEKMSDSEPIGELIDQRVLYELLRDDVRSIRWRMNGDLMNAHFFQSGTFFLRHLCGECESFRKAYFNRSMSEEAQWAQSYLNGLIGRYLEVVDDSSCLDGLLRRGWRGVLNVNTDKTFDSWWNAYHGWGHFSVGRAEADDRFDLVAFHSGAKGLADYVTNLRRAKMVIIFGPKNDDLHSMVLNAGFIKLVHRTSRAIFLAREGND